MPMVAGASDTPPNRNSAKQWPRIDPGSPIDSSLQSPEAAEANHHLLPDEPLELTSTLREPLPALTLAVTSHFACRITLSTVYSHPD